MGIYAGAILFAGLMLCIGAFMLGQSNWGMQSGGYYGKI